MPAISRRLVARAIGTRLATVTNATGWYGQIGAKYGLPGVTDTPNAPLPKSTDDPRVQPYFVLYPGVGSPSGEGDVADTFVDLVEVVQVTVAGGDVDDVLALADRVDAALYRWEPDVAVTGVKCGPLRPPPGYAPPLLTDRDITPARLFVPLQYQLTVHT